MPSYNGSTRRSNAQGNKNSKCEVYTSPKLKELLKAMPPREATLYGKGSVAASGNVPIAYSVQDCTQHGKVIGNGNTMLGGLTKGVGYVPPYFARVGEELLYCNHCREWVLAHGHQQYIPKPAQAPKYVKPYFGVNGINGNAFAEPQHR